MMPIKKAFTLIELLIVVAIIAILAAIAVPNFLEAQTRSKVSRTKADMRSLVTAIEAYRADNNDYFQAYVQTIPGNQYYWSMGWLYSQWSNRSFDPRNCGVYLTTPIAYMLEHRPAYSGLDAMFHGEAYEKHAQLIMLQPYRRGRVPVVFVHGLMSSPMTWTPLLNEVLADPLLRERCQFWFFRYPTGYPVLYSAALLREALRTAARTFDNMAIGFTVPARIWAIDVETTSHMKSMRPATRSCSAGPAPR